MTKEEGTRKNAKLLIKIISTVLLAVAFFSEYENALLGQGIGEPRVPFLILSFAIGVFTLLFLFLSCIIEEKKAKISLNISYFLSGIFMISILQMLIGGWNGLKTNILDKIFSGSFLVLLDIVIIITIILIWRNMKR